jgi:hypothetical protein
MRIKIKKAILNNLFFLVVILIMTIPACDELDDWTFETEDWTIETENWELVQEELAFLKLPIDIKFDANVLLTNVKRDEFVVTLYLSSKYEDVPLEIELSNIASYLQYDTNYYFGKIKLIPISESNKNLSLSMVMDYSGSMMGDIGYLEDAVSNFIDNFQDGDMGEIIKFGSRIDQVQSLTNDKARLRDAITKRSHERGGTSLLTAINQGIDNLVKSTPQNSKAVIAFTDGWDNESRISSNTLINNSLTNKTPVFCVNLESNSSGIGGYGRFRNGHDLLNEISLQSGGFYYQTPDAKQINELYKIVKIIIIVIIEMRILFFFKIII